jgi:hypothetical protein
MQFQVPQFIETEDKIVGPLTLQQFLYITVSTIVVFFLYFVLATWLWVIVGIIIEGAALTLSLVKVNGRPMRIVATSAFFYVWNPRVYIYHSSLEIATSAPAPEIQTALKANKTHPTSGLRSLLDKLTTTKQAIPNRESPLPEVLKATSRESVKERYELIRKITGDEEVARRVDYR